MDALVQPAAFQDQEQLLINALAQSVAFKGSLTFSCRRWTKPQLMHMKSAATTDTAPR